MKKNILKSQESDDSFETVPPTTANDFGSNQTFNQTKSLASRQQSPTTANQKSFIKINNDSEIGLT